MEATNFYSYRIARLHDAQMDMIDGLNQLTDLTNPCYERVQEMMLFSKAIKDLQKTICMIREVEDEEEEEIMERAKMRCDTKMEHAKMAQDMEHMKSKLSPV